MISKTKPCFNFEEIKSVFSFSKNPIERFEKEFAKLTESKYALSFAYGRTGIYALLKSQGINNKEVIVPAYTCIVVPNAIVTSGNKPVFVDISLEDYNMDIDKIKITPRKPKPTKLYYPEDPYTKAIIATHMYGYPADIKKIKKKVGKNVFIIEDAALGLLTTNVGKYSDAAIYSFNMAKQMCTFDGCMVTTNNKDVYKKLKDFREKNCMIPKFTSIMKKYLMLLSSYVLFSNVFYGLVYRLYYMNKSSRKLVSNWGTDRIEMPYDYLSNLSNIQARIGLAQLKKIRRNVVKRRILGLSYFRALEYFKPVKWNMDCSYSHFTIRVKNRNKFIRKLEESGLPIGKSFDFDYVVPLTPAYNTKGDFKNAEIAAKEIVNLPFRPNLLMSEVNYILYKVLENAKNTK